MDRQQAAAALAALETDFKSRADELRKIIEGPERAPSLLTKPEPGSGAYYWDVRSSCSDGLYPKICRAMDLAGALSYAHGNIFQTEAIAKAYAEAIDTMLLLRHQPGTVVCVYGPEQWVIVPDDDLSDVEPDDWHGRREKTRCISPCFDTCENARAAIDTIGADRILRMFKTLHGIYGEQA